MRFTLAALVRGNVSLTARLVLGSGLALVGCGAALLYSILRGEIIDQRATLSEQLREEMIDGGYVTEQEIDRDIARLDDANFMMPSPIMWAAWGQRVST